MAISDTLFEAQQEIEKYLATGGYGNPGDQDRDQIDNLLIQMARVRVMLDTFPWRGREQNN